jgi:L-aminopeptidase/D-esterase-like protein
MSKTLLATLAATSLLVISSSAASRAPQPPRIPYAPQAPATRTFQFDFPGVLIGTAEYADGPTGCTVLHFPGGSALAYADVRGGATATREISSIDLHNTWGALDALVLAGGSTYGLEAASGVMEELLRRNGGKIDFLNIPAVPAAVVYDFSGRKNSLYPDKALGAQALRNARENQVTVGRAGAGANVTVGKVFGRAWAERSGQGAAFVEVAGVKVLAISVVNALGNILDRQGRIVAGSRDPRTGQRIDIVSRLRAEAAKPDGGNPRPEGVPPSKGEQRSNTTVSVIVTNAELSRPDLARIASMAHTAMGRMIEPFQTPSDGDTLFVVSTATHKLPEKWTLTDFGTLAAGTMQDAVQDAVR